MFGMKRKSWKMKMNIGRKINQKILSLNRKSTIFLKQTLKKNPLSLS